MGIGTEAESQAHSAEERSANRKGRVGARCEIAERSTCSGMSFLWVLAEVDPLVRGSFRGVRLSHRLGHPCPIRPMNRPPPRHSVPSNTWTPMDPTQRREIQNARHHLSRSESSQEMKTSAPQSSMLDGMTIGPAAITTGRRQGWRKTSHLASPLYFDYTTLR